LAIALFLCLARPACAENLTGDIVWSGLVELDETVEIFPEAVLTVKPGTRIKITNPLAKISVRGVLRVDGSKTAPVVFDSPSGWEGIEFMQAANGSRLSGVRIQGAKAAVSSFATNFDVDNSTFRDCEAGIKPLRESAPVITDSTFENNQIGLVNEMKSGAVVRGNRFIGHHKTAILTSHGSTGEITGNHFEKNKQGIAVLQKFLGRIAKNRFVANETGIYCNQSQSTPLIENNRFESNTYAMINFSFAYPVVKGNVFVDNEMAVRNDQYGSPLLQNNLFGKNQTALYNYRKSNPRVRKNQFEQNQRAIFCDFSSYPEIKQNNFIDNVMAVELGIYQSADWEKRSGSKTIMQREALNRQSQNPLLAQAPTEFRDEVDVSENWWGDQTVLLDKAGQDGNVTIFHDRRDQPKVTYEGYGSESYRIDRVKFAPWLKQPVEEAGPEGDHE
jgi:nitrous oxidase accessory protein NosD